MYHFPFCFSSNGVPQDYLVSSVKDIDFGDIMGVYSVNISHNAQYLAAGCGNGSIQVEMKNLIYIHVHV